MEVKTRTYDVKRAAYDPRTARAISLLQAHVGQALAKSRRGALFSLGEVPASGRNQFPFDPARRPENSFLDALFDLAGSSPDYATDVSSLEEHLGVSRPAILKACSKLISLGLLVKAEVAYYPHRRAVSVYVLQPEVAAPSPPPLTAVIPVQTEMPIGEELLRQAVTLRYDTRLDRTLPWKGERLIVFNLTALLRSGRTGPDTQSISLQLRQGKRYCQAEARAAAGTMLAGVLDLRPLIVLLTLVRQHLVALNSNVVPENLFQIRLRDICEALAIDPSSSNARAIHAQLERWLTTTFRIVDDLYGIFDWVEREGVGALSRGFQVFSGFDALSWAGQEGLTPDVIQVRLYPPIFQALRGTDRVLSVHKEILQDRKPHPLRHKLYYWCRRVVQHSHEPREYLLDHVRSEVTPKKPLPEFRRELREALAEHAKQGESFRAWLPGYRLQYQPSPRAKHDVISIWADPRDPVVGEDTNFTRRLPKE